MALLSALIFCLMLPEGPIASAASSASVSQRSLNALAQKINRLESALETTQVRLATLHKGVTSAEKSLAMARKGTTALTQNLYIDSLGDAAALMNAASVAEFGDRVTFVEHLRAENMDILQRVSISRRRLERKQVAIAKILKEQQTVLRSLGRERSALARLFQAQQDRQRALDRARRSSVRASRSDPPSFSPSPTVVVGSGPFQVCPVDSPRAYSDDFGAPRAGHRHQGNDILAPRGTPIRAPFDGTFKANTSGMGGNQARVMGSLGYVFNAHLSGFAGVSSGSHVSAGTVIGYVGNSGNASGGPTHDHFEWHPGNGSAVDPYRYLNKVC